jgi:hypothetical protein
MKHLDPEDRIVVTASVLAFFARAIAEVIPW